MLWCLYLLFVKDSYPFTRTPQNIKVLLLVFWSNNDKAWLTPGELTLLGPCYTKNLVEIQKVIFWSAAILNWVAMLVAILCEQLH